MRIKGKGYKKSGMIAEYIRKEMFFLFDDHSRTIKNSLRGWRNMKQRTHKNNVFSLIKKRRYMLSSPY